MFDLYPRHGHRTPQQIAEDAGGSFEPARTTRMKIREKNDSAGELAAPRADEAIRQIPPPRVPQKQ